jgi:hypothetical protein
MNKTLIYMRILGSFLVVSAYFIVLWVDVAAGSATHLVANAVTIPFFVKIKGWDVVIMLSFLSCIDISKLLSLVQWNQIFMFSS